MAPEATSPEGAALYASRCAACHDHASGRVPPKVLISVTRAAEDVIDTLTLGVMRTQAAGLSAGTDPQPGRLHHRQGAPAAGLPGCQSLSREQPPRRSPPATGAAGDATWPAGASSRDPGFSAAQVPRLKLRWTFAYPGRAAFNQPAVVGDLVLTGGTGGRVFALDARTGCTHWSYDAGALVRTGIVIDEIPATRAPEHPARLVAWFGDDKGTLHAIDLKDGKRAVDRCASTSTRSPASSARRSCTTACCMRR